MSKLKKIATIEDAVMLVDLNGDYVYIDIRFNELSKICKMFDIDDILIKMRYIRLYHNIFYFHEDEYIYRQNYDYEITREFSITRARFNKLGYNIENCIYQIPIPIIVDVYI